MGFDRTDFKRFKRCPRNNNSEEEAKVEDNSRPRTN